ncbi:hypothetical protein OPIT5_15565 [Opitutaceae bacterium TAV5]|nr:hypothetical protein OPIT5_15565 [Opitutaceae bacterium TAV5]
MKTDTRIRLRPGLVAVLVSLLCPFSVRAAEAVVFSEDFEAPKWAAGAQLGSTAINGWIGNDNGTTLLSRIIDTDAHSGSQSLHLYDNISGNSASARYDLGSTLTQGYIEFSIKQAGGGNFYLYFSDAGTDTTNFYLSLAPNGTVTLNSPAASTQVAYTVTDWNTFRLYFDETTNTASVSLNGTSIVSVATGDADATNWQVGKIRLQAGAAASTNTRAYFDDITVVNTAAIPEPSTYAAVAGIGALALALWWRRRR